MRTKEILVKTHASETPEESGVFFVEYFDRMPGIAEYNRDEDRWIPRDNSKSPVQYYYNPEERYVLAQDELDDYRKEIIDDFEYAFNDSIKSIENVGRRLIEVSENYSDHLKKMKK